MNRITFFFILLLMSFTPEFSKHPDKSGMDGFDIEGHRGCRGLMPENTIPAMLKAIDLGVNTLEMDVVITKDKKVVVSHEPWFETEITTKPDGGFIDSQDVLKYNIYTMDYDSVKRYDVGLKPHPRFPDQQKIKVYKPLLSDLFDSVEEYIKSKKLSKIDYNIEIKSLPAGDNKYHPATEEFAELLVEVINMKNLADRVIIQSFDFRSLKYLHEKHPSIRLSMLIEDSDVDFFEGQLNRLGFTPQIYSPNQTLVDDKLVKQCHEKGMKIIPWTVNDPKQFKKLKKMGVDGVITDYPDRIK